MVGPITDACRVRMIAKDRGAMLTQCGYTGTCSMQALDDASLSFTDNEQSKANTTQWSTAFLSDHALN